MELKLQKTIENRIICVCPIFAMVFFFMDDIGWYWMALDGARHCRAMPETGRHFGTHDIPVLPHWPWPGHGQVWSRPHRASLGLYGPPRGLLLSCIRA